MPNQKLSYEYNCILASKTLSERLKMIDELCQKPIFTTSLGREDQVLLWHIMKQGLPIRITTLQTGRLFAETLSLINMTRERYGIEIEEVTPEPDHISTYIDRHGKNGFYNSIEARKACCNVRKVQPLTKILNCADGWITGLTREQSNGRSNIPFALWDDQHQIMKFSPLADVSTSSIDADITAHEIPTNPLHNKGYPSIGCEPCTRAIKTGEHPRAGRWWWENDDSQECGLHQPAVTASVNLASNPARTAGALGKSTNVGC